MKFRSKIDWWAYLVFLGWLAANLWFIISYIVNGGLASLIIVIFFTPFSVLIMAPMLLRSYYLFDDESKELVIRCGLGKGTRIAYDLLASAERTRNPISSPALSMDRVEVKFKSKSGKFSDTIIISPNDREGFFAELKARNENIEISNEIQPLSKGYKILLIGILAFLGVILIVVAASSFGGLSDPNIYIQNDSLQIKGMYGLSVRLENITSVTLIEESMREIYGGDSVIRTNGFGGMGQSNKGHFRSTTLGAHMLFVQANTSPTIRIQRQGSDIFISFRESERTRQLYYEIAAALPG